LVAFAIFTLVAFVGLGVDLGMAYIARVRVRRAVDAAALAAASELPLENASHFRALEYLAENQYDCQLTMGGSVRPQCANPNVRVEVNTADTRDGYTYVTGPSVDAADFVIEIDTSAYVDAPDGAPLPDSANRIRVSVREQVGLYFMRVFGFNSVPVFATSVAENISDLDVVLVFDESGSMEFDTRCYGCWTPASGQAYPDGTFWFLPWGNAGDAVDDPPNHCKGAGADPPYIHQGNRYIVIEAEDYSRLSSPYQRSVVEVGQTYWVLGRNANQAASWMGRGSYLGRDSVGAYIAYAPARTHDGADGTGVPCSWSDLETPDSRYSFPAERVCSRHPWVISQGGPFMAPRIDYTFTVDKNKTWYIWLRGAGGGQQDAPDKNHWVFWGLSGGSYGSHNLMGRSKDWGNSGNYTNGAASAGWRWKRMGCGEGDSSCGVNLQPGVQYTLHLWGGSPGFDVDRIIITDNTTTDPNSGSFDDVKHRDYNDALDVHGNDIFDNNRTDWACYPCDPRYGGRPSGTGGDGVPRCTSDMVPQPNTFLDDLWDDEQPIRGSVEAGKAFIRRLNPRFDQIGLVTYDSTARIRSELECVRRLGPDNCDMQDLENTVIAELDDTHAGGGTNIAHGIKLGTEVLSNRDGHMGRPAAAHIMIVMTDGEANQTRELDGACDDDPNLWPNDDERAKDCSVYYAMQARNNGIVIYSITLGEGADIELMEHIAELTGGIHRHAPTTEQLGPIFNELYSRIFLRIVE
jgi:hypothetical protein